MGGDLIITRRCLVRRALACALVLGSPAHGVCQQRGLGPGAPALATTRYEAGVARYRAGDFSGAATEFRVALSALPGSATLAFNLGRAEERAGQLEAAILAYRRYLELAPLADDRREVETVLSTLEQQLDRSRPWVEVEASVAGATLRIDGADAGPAPRRIRLAAGGHAVEAAAPRHRPASLRIDVQADAPRRWRLELEPEEVSTAAPAPASSLPADPPPVRTRVALGWVATGLGAVALGVGIQQTVTAAGIASDAESPAAGDADRQARLSDDLDGAKLGMGLGYGLGAAFVGVGLGLLLWPETAETQPNSARVHVGPTHVVLGGQF